MEALMAFVAFCAALFFVLRFVYRRIPFFSQTQRIKLVASDRYVTVLLVDRMTMGAYSYNRQEVETVWLEAGPTVAPFEARLQAAVEKAQEQIERNKQVRRSRAEAAKKIKRAKRKVRT